MTIYAARTLHMGDTDDVWGRVTEDTEADISGVPLQLRVITPAGVVGSWNPPQDEDRAVPHIIRAAARVTPAAEGQHTLQAKLTPTGRVVILTLGTFNVIAP